jgi:hypothetical protein
MEGLAHPAALKYGPKQATDLAAAQRVYWKVSCGQAATGPPLRIGVYYSAGQLSGAWDA